MNIYLLGIIIYFLAVGSWMVYEIINAEELDEHEKTVNKKNNE